MNGCGDRFDFMELGRQPMHLPFSGNQRFHALLDVDDMARAGSRSANLDAGDSTKSPSHSSNERENTKRGHKASASQDEREQEAENGGYNHVFILDRHRRFHFQTNIDWG